MKIMECQSYINQNNVKTWNFLSFWWICCSKGSAVYIGWQFSSKDKRRVPRYKNISVSSGRSAFELWNILAFVMLIVKRVAGADWRICSRESVCSVGPASLRKALHLRAPGMSLLQHIRQLADIIHGISSANLVNCPSPTRARFYPERKSAPAKRGMNGA